MERGEKCLMRIVLLLLVLLVLYQEMLWHGQSIKEPEECAENFDEALSEAVTSSSQDMSGNRTCVSSLMMTTARYFGFGRVRTNRLVNLRDLGNGNGCFRSLDIVSGGELGTYIYIGRRIGSSTWKNR